MTAERRRLLVPSLDKEAKEGRDFPGQDADPPAFPDGFEGGDWSTYWYNGHIYESDLVWGLLTWRINDPRVTAYYRTPFSNPQSQLFTID